MAVAAGLGGGVVVQAHACHGHGRVGSRVDGGGFCACGCGGDLWTARGSEVFVRRELGWSELTLMEWKGVLGRTSVATTRTTTRKRS